MRRVPCHPPRRWLRWLLAGGLAALALGAGHRGAAAREDPCLECHGRPGFGVEGHPLWITPEAYGRGVHGRLACSDCHKGAEGFPHERSVRVRCDLPCHAPGPTHEAVATAEAGGVHAAVAEPACLGCHGAARAEEGADAVCRGCHGEPGSGPGRFPDGPGAFGRSAHREAGPRGPGCTDCHGYHGVARGKAARGACAAERCHPGAGPRFAALFDHGGTAPAPPWGGAGRVVAWVGLGMALVLLLHAVRG